MEDTKKRQRKDNEPKIKYYSKNCKKYCGYSNTKMAQLLAAVPPVGPSVEPPVIGLPVASSNEPLAPTDMGKRSSYFFVCVKFNFLIFSFFFFLFLFSNYR